jgi:hypothetical protein
VQRIEREESGQSNRNCGRGRCGGFTGAHMVQGGEDVTFIDPWPEHVDHMSKNGLRVTHAKEVKEFSVQVRARPSMAQGRISSTRTSETLQLWCEQDTG